MKRYIGTALLLLSLHGAAWGGGETVTLSINKEPLDKVVALIADGAVSFARDVGDKNMLVNAHFDRVPSEEALTVVLSPLDLTYRKEKQSYVIVRQPKVSPHIQNRPISQALHITLGGEAFYFTDGADPDTPVTIALENMPLDRALDYILEAKGYKWRRNNGTYVIYRDKEASFTCEAINMAQEIKISSSRATGSTGTSASSSGVTSTSSGSGGGNQYNGGISASSGSTTSSANVVTVETLTKTLKDMLTAEGKLTIHAETGLVWVKDTAERVERIGKFIEELNRLARKTVYINGIITEVTLSNGHQTGVNWQSVINTIAHRSASITIDANKIAAPAMTLDFMLDSENERLILTALEEFGDVKVVSRPKIAVSNFAVGSLTVGDTVSYIAQAYSSNQTNYTTTNSLIVEPLQVGLSFYVLPKVLNEEEAQLYIAPDLTTLQEIRTIRNNDLTVEAPKLNQRQTQSVIRVKKGQKILLSGMMSEADKVSTSGVPFLMDIPYLGRFFKSTSTEKIKSEFSLLLEVNW